jgi:multidrug transporter EmrE-like cation transporter
MAILLLSVISMTFLNETVTTLKVFGLSFCILGILMVLY